MQLHLWRSGDLILQDIQQMSLGVTYDGRSYPAKLAALYSPVGLLSPAELHSVLYNSQSNLLV
jgi:hypothetical protein